ncbi:hypothetical protein M9H77_16341 [Catharanthus roseus]|uniref:Uncharacterized protein n=1 Tax=Catharanthus roseus TaxID=4058 RepID=A0ACC0B1N8_CATRO|nr:hypothetical protein M9H77_16341 [Catharanthus roseus]
MKNKIDTWTARCYHHNDNNYCAWYIRIKKKATNNRWEITRFVKEHTCLVQIEQNKHRNLSSKFISIFISHLVANDTEIPVSNIIQEVQVLYQTGCTYKRAWYVRKFAIERVFGSWDTTFNILTKYLQALRKMQTYTLSCSHVLAVCRENGSRIDAYVPEIYSRQTYIKTYQTNFHPVLSENFWRDVPFNLTFYPPNIKKERGRKQGKRFQGEMDYRNPDSPPRCGRCRMPGHNRKNCNNPRPSNV